MADTDRMAERCVYQDQRDIDQIAVLTHPLSYYDSNDANTLTENTKRFTTSDTVSTNRRPERQQREWFSFIIPGIDTIM